MKQKDGNKIVLGKTSYANKYVIPILFLVFAGLMTAVGITSGIWFFWIIAAILALLSVPFWLLPMDSVVYDSERQLLLVRGGGFFIFSVFKVTEIPIAQVTSVEDVPMAFFGGFVRNADAGLHIYYANKCIRVNTLQAPHKVEAKLNELLGTIERSGNSGASRELDSFAVAKLYAQTQPDETEGTAVFVKEGLEFSVGGKFAVEKDYNGKAGYHLAFRIESNGLTFAPEEYSDVCDYESTGFQIEVGYFDDFPFGDENENGVIVESLSALEGTTLKLRENGGYVLACNTAETDNISCGQITILKWEEEKCVVSFKFAVPCGLNDVVAGTAELIKDEIR